MKCPQCGSEDIKVNKTEQLDSAVKRLRECCTCGQKWWTKEEKWICYRDPSLYVDQKV